MTSKSSERIMSAALVIYIYSFHDCGVIMMWSSYHAYTSFSTGRHHVPYVFTYIYTHLYLICVSSCATMCAAGHCKLLYKNYLNVHSSLFMCCTTQWREATQLDTHQVLFRLSLQYQGHFTGEFPQSHSEIASPLFTSFLKKYLSDTSWMFWWVVVYVFFCLNL